MEAKKWIGVDIHKKQFTVCAIHSDDTQEFHEYKRESAGIAEFLREVDSETVIGIESTTWTWDFARKLKEVAKDVIIFNTVELKTLMDKVKKTDKADAEKIATVVRRFKKSELSVCKIKEECFAEIKGLLKIREQLVGQKTQLKNQVIAMLDYWGCPKPEKKLFGRAERDLKWISAQTLSASIRKSIEGLYQLILNLQKQVKELDKNIEELSLEHKGYLAIREGIRGIGNISGAYLISKIENIGRFESPKKLTSYLGLAPRVSISDGKGYNGRITGRTDKGLLRVIVQAAWAAVRYNPELRSFYENLKPRRGRQKAVVAVARKMVVQVFYILKNSLPVGDNLPMNGK